MEHGSISFCTIGHSNHPIDKFVSLLHQNGIDLLVDVRSAPYSKFYPQFNREELETRLPQFGVKYVYAGRHLGGRPNDPTCYKNGKLPDQEADYIHEVNYPEVMKRDWFKKGIDRLLGLAKLNKVVIMCSEEDPAHCHRHHLISRYIMEQHPEVKILHIRGDGVVFSASQIKSSVNQSIAEQPTLFGQ